LVLSSEALGMSIDKVKARSRRHARFAPVVAYVVSGIVGGIAGLLIALDAYRRDRSGPGRIDASTAGIPLLASMVAIVAGVLLA